MNRTGSVCDESVQCNRWRRQPCAAGRDAAALSRPSQIAGSSALRLRQVPFLQTIPWTAAPCSPDVGVTQAISTALCARPYRAATTLRKSSSGSSGQPTQPAPTSETGMRVRRDRRQQRTLLLRQSVRAPVLIVHQGQSRSTQERHSTAPL